MSVALKHSARITGLGSEILFAIQVAEGVWKDKSLGLLTITSCMDGKHSAGSKHYVGKAVDFRTMNLTNDQIQFAASELKDRLGNVEYDVVVEGDHIHVEHDPKTPLNNTGATA